MIEKIIILGSKGQLGTELCHQLEPRDDLRLVAADVEECDITDGEQVRRFFADHAGRGEEATAVINCAAFTAVDDAEEKRDLAMAINARGAGNIAAACRDVGARLVHISTDFVFGDGHNSPIKESARPDPLSVYGASKLAGEELAMQNNPATAVLRTSGLYSPWGKNFVRSIAGYARKKGALSVVHDQIVGPTPVAPLAEVAVELATAPVFMGGVYHATVEGGCSWREFTQAIVDLLQIDAQISPTTARQWGAPAKRPSYSVLDNERLRLVGLDRFRRWDEELELFIGRYGDTL